MTEKKFNDKEYQKRYYEENKIHINKKNNDYYNRHKEKVLQQHNVYRNNNKEKIKQSDKLYAEVHKEEIKIANQKRHKKNYEDPIFREVKRQKALEYRTLHRDTINVKGREYSIKHPEVAIRYRQKHKGEFKIKDRITNLYRLYNLTLDQYNEMLNNQGGGCAICGAIPEKFKRALPIDHDHNTGKIRGILCPNCNLILGNAKENIEILYKIIEYLIKHKNE